MLTRLTPEVEVDWDTLQAVHSSGQTGYITDYASHIHQEEYHLARCIIIDWKIWGCIGYWLEDDCAPITHYFAAGGHSGAKH